MSTKIGDLRAAAAEGRTLNRKAMREAILAGDRLAVEWLRQHGAQWPAPGPLLESMMKRYPGYLLHLFLTDLDFLTDLTVAESMMPITRRIEHALAYWWSWQSEAGAEHAIPERDWTYVNRIRTSRKTTIARWEMWAAIGASALFERQFNMVESPQPVRPGLLYGDWGLPELLVIRDDEDAAKEAV